MREESFCVLDPIQLVQVSIATLYCIFEVKHGNTYICICISAVQIDDINIHKTCTSLTHLYIVHTLVHRAHTCTSCTHLYIVHTLVHRAHTCTLCTHVYIVHTLVHRPHTCTSCIYLYIVHTLVHRAHTCTLCTHLYIVHTRVHCAHTCTSCTHLYIVHILVHRAHTCTSCTHLYIVHTLVHRAHTCTSCTHLCIVHTLVHRAHTCTSSSAISVGCPDGCLTCDYGTIDGSSGGQFCPSDSCMKGYTWRSNSYGGECIRKYPVQRSGLQRYVSVMLEVQCRLYMVYRFKQLRCTVREVSRYYLLIKNFLYKCTSR